MKDQIHFVHSMDGLGLNRKGDALLCIAWGETDRPDAFIAKTLGDVKRFLVTEWLGDENAPELIWLMESLQEHDWNEASKLQWDLEIGGVSIQDVVNVKCQDNRGFLDSIDRAIEKKRRIAKT